VLVGRAIQYCFGCNQTVDYYALVEAAWIAVNYHHYWKTQFDHQIHRKPRNKAIVAIARKLLIAS
jgi:hypothetical protein